jgi:hypothetical protein
MTKDFYHRLTVSVVFSSKKKLLLLFKRKQKRKFTFLCFMFAHHKFKANQKIKFKKIITKN